MATVLTITAIVLGVVSSLCDDLETETETLCVKQVNDDGFGDINNQYAFAMTEFKGSLYVATLNAKSFPGMALFFVGLPFDTDGVQIWKGDYASMEWTWENMVTQGNGNQHNYGIRKMVVVGEYIYAVTANHISGFEIWRSFDGSTGTWDVIMNGGFNDTENSSGRGLLEYNGYLYVGAENRNTGAKIYRRCVQEDGSFCDDNEDFEAVTENGLDDPSNWWFSDFAEYRGFMYAGTLNIKGMQLYRTSDGINYDKIFDGGNGNPLETAAMKLRVFDDKLYIGTMNFLEGASLYANSDQHGRIFQPIFTNGNGNQNNAYVWYLKEFNDRLYAATFKTFGEFDLYSSDDGKKNTWIAETYNAFGNDNQYGIRSMWVFDEKLMIGSATARHELACQIYQATAKDVPSGSGSVSISNNFKHKHHVKTFFGIGYEDLLLVACFGVIAVFACFVGIFIGKRMSFKKVQTKVLDDL